ncbi:TetR/AcrR family transcriptional regulator [Amycolatopsis sp. H20-H5]|uniref:TetR/AcrR family transcriptional regulator n=1 Tax=Amycolatopsis sp. H20-H5 TaxID=3046309 RepID=UPI002DB5C2D5|nr:TetR/AcrR family transcriptional regulator [Amycolatopsis sp. H20-H5]MEC3979981.1 TetR/AcrR family transcriptional regulator [Amycolatopsis sp. H20-H5]
MTREKLIAVATGLFTEPGYDDTSIEAVLRESGVSRGALYHHFAGKDALFAAVVDTVYDRVDEHLATAVHGLTEPAAALREGCLAWIRFTTDPVVRRVLLIDAPAVLGWQRWRELDEQRTLGLIKVAFRGAVADGLVEKAQASFFAHAVLAAMNEIAMMIARAADHDLAAAEAETAVRELLRRLLGQA